jgi:hypothetical protein
VEADVRAACAGQWELFDSTDPFDHQTAAAICETCPIRRDCDETLAKAKRAAHHELVRYGPTGTWAGQLVGGDGRNPYRLAAEEQMFTEDELRKAHRRHAAGLRDDRTVMGERVYQRKRARIKRDRKDAA